MPTVVGVQFDPSRTLATGGLAAVRVLASARAASAGWPLSLMSPDGSLAAAVSSLTSLQRPPHARGTLHRCPSTTATYRCCRIRAPQWPDPAPTRTSATGRMPPANLCFETSLGGRLSRGLSSRALEEGDWPTTGNGLKRQNRPLGMGSGRARLVRLDEGCGSPARPRAGPGGTGVRRPCGGLSLPTPGACTVGALYSRGRPPRRCSANSLIR